MPVLKMAFTRKTIAIVAVATMVIMAQNSNGYSGCNATVQRESETKLELIELMIPRHIRNRGEIINDDTKIGASGEQRFEILIKQNTNGRDVKGTSKIKIFVESDEYRSEKPLSKIGNQNATDFQENKNGYQPVPLTINNADLNVDRQRSKDNSEPFLSATAVNGKVQTVKFPNKNSSFVHEVEKKESQLSQVRENGAQIVKVTSQISPPRNGSISQKTGDVLEQDKLITEELFLMSKPTKAFEVNISPNEPMEEINMGKQKPNVFKTSLHRPLLYENNPKELPQHHRHHHHQQSFESLPTLYHKDEIERPVGKQLVYEPDAGISATHIHSYNGKRFAEHPRTLTSYNSRAEGGTAGDFGYEETRTTSNRRLANTNSDGRPVHEHLLPGRKPYLDNNHSDIRSPPNNHYRKDGVQYTEENSATEVRSDIGYSSEGKSIFHSDSDPFIYDRPEDTSGTSNADMPHQPSSHKEYSNRYITTTHPSVRQITYSGGYNIFGTGFPESQTGNGFQSSRQTPYDGSNALPSSPCPTVFEYTKHESDRWYADIYVTTDVVLNGMRLDVMLNKRADILGAFSAEVKSTDNLSFTILSLKKTLVPGTTEIVQIVVKYNADGGRTAPFVKTINLNGRMICPTMTNLSPKTTTKRPTYAFPGDIQEAKRTTTTERIQDLYTRPAVHEYFTTTSKPNGNFKRTTPPTHFIPAPIPDAYEPSDYNEQRPTTKRPNPNRPIFSNKPSSPGLSNSDNRRSTTTYEGIIVPNSNRKPTAEESKNIPCGLPAIQPRPLITNGQKTSRGQWPWHAAIYKNVGPNLSYSCGGSLVTNLHVVTAAHCATMEYTTTPVEPKILLVYFGKYHLRVWTENGIANREVARITIHPNYNATDFRSDIAILTLAKRIEFTDFIRPVCLWDRRNTKIDDIVGFPGTVVGWGFDETQELTEELKQAKMPVVKHNECLWSYPDFYPKFTSNTTYCAGFKNGTSVCNGDSGGGMVFPIKVNKEERWFLRGLVSLSPGLKDTRVCDTHQYVVFTDVAKFLPWLEDLIS